MNQYGDPAGSAGLWPTNMTSVSLTNKTGRYPKHSPAQYVTDACGLACPLPRLSDVEWGYSIIDAFTSRMSLLAYRAKSLIKNPISHRARTVPVQPFRRLPICFRSRLTFPLPLPRGERKGVRGKVRGHQACSAAQALNLLKTSDIYSPDHCRQLGHFALTGS